MNKDDVLNQFDGKDWDYSVLSKIAKQSGGVKEFVDRMYDSGFKAGAVASAAVGAVAWAVAVAFKFGKEKYKEHKLKKEIENIACDVNENDDNGVEK